jgi:hypothetical protein
MFIIARSAGFVKSAVVDNGLGPGGDRHPLSIVTKTAQRWFLVSIVSLAFTVPACA